MGTPTTVMVGRSAGAAAALCALLFMAPAQATEFSIGGAWDLLEDKTFAPIEAPTPRDSNLPVSFTAQSDVLTNAELTIGYTMPALGSFALDVDHVPESWTEPSNSLTQWTPNSDVYGSYATSFLGGQFGVFGGVTDQHSAFSLAQTTSRTFGAAVGYAGFYVRGAYQDAGPDGLLDSRRAWQAGLGYGSDAFDVRLTYVESQFIQGSPTEIEGKQWMIGGMVQLTPSILLNANAFFVDREIAMPTVEPPGAGARVGLQLRF
jgi:hypothetical protein